VLCPASNKLRGIGAGPGAAMLAAASGDPSRLTGEC